jgi:minor extracellular serine protease Vpr
MFRYIGKFVLCIPLLLGAARAQSLTRYALLLENAPLGKQLLKGTGSRTALSTPSAEMTRRSLLKAQEALRSDLSARRIVTTGATQTLLNAVFVTATREQIDELRTLPGVIAIVPMHRLKPSLNKVVDIVKARPAWAAAGGSTNAGAGIKIAVLDTGIDETHPGFKDASLPIPTGYPKYSSADDANHATNKVIAVRSFVAPIAAGDGTPEFSRPDDLSARDRVGHGTAVAMIAAGGAHESPLGTISGIAPKAWLGNYKIFGSPGVIDFTTADVVLQALESAFNDGMDVAILSAGSLAAMWETDDRGSICNNADTEACDPWAAAVTTAMRGGMTVVVPAGNGGAYGPNTIDTPGHVPAAITVGATTNARTLASTAVTPDGSRIPLQFGDGPKLVAALKAPLKRAAEIDATELACLPLPAGSLNGSIALIARGNLVARGNCGFATKVKNAQAAGAIAVLIFREERGSSLYRMTGLSNTGIPAALISAESGSFLKSYLVNHPATVLTVDPPVVESTGTAEGVAAFSGRGPGMSGSAIKPELVAPGAGVYTAAQNYDPNGDLYSADRYIGVDGTSFAAAVVGGAVALVKQAHPDYNSAQLKSAVTNTADGVSIEYDDSGNTVPAKVSSAGGGRLNAEAAIATTITLDPATVAFGIVKNVPLAKTLTVTNTGKTLVTLQLTVNPLETDSRATVRVGPSSMSLQPGMSANVTISLAGGMPGPGSYEGSITVGGGAVPVRVPYSYIVGDGVPRTLIPLTGDGFVTEAGTAVQWAFKAIDRYGAPVPAVQVRFAPAGSVYAATPATDAKGIAEAYLYTSEQTGEQSFLAQLQGAGGIEFRGRTRPQPQIVDNGVRDAASLLVPARFAPGSYVSIFGAGLSESTAVFRTPYLPLSLAGVSVSFDVPSADIHAPGHVSFVSDGQINVQIPWELAGADSAIMKVTLSNSASRSVRNDNGRLATFRTQTITVPIGPHSPAFFEYREAASGRTLAAAIDEQYRVITSGNPARPGKIVQFFMNGLGGVIDGSRPASGEISPPTPLARTTMNPEVSIGGMPARVEFSGLAPLNVGLYQVNCVLPAGLASGIQSVELAIGGVTARSSIVVQ